MTIPPTHIHRRNFLLQSGSLSSIALTTMLLGDGAADEFLGIPHVQGGQQLHHPPKAKRVIQLFMSGAASQCDTFDYKPQLDQRHGEQWSENDKVELFQSKPGKFMKSPWPWRQYGQCGKWINDCVAPLGRCVDDMAFVHNMVSKSNVHGPATFMQATGFILPGFPAAGSWVSYGLGSQNENLPTFVVLPDSRGFAPNGPKNWGAGFLPASHSGTMIRPSHESPINDLYPPPTANFISDKSQRASLEALEQLNRMHLKSHAGDSRLLSRIKSYELAARMQLSATDVLDISDEPASIRQLYGVEAPNTSWDGPMNEGEETRLFGLNCLIGRRLIERGVRFVQIWSGADNGHPRRNWDSHEDLGRDHWPLARGMSRGAAALLIDLKQRGLLDDTIVHWTTEFGRMPCSQGTLGRDHNPATFTNWLAGGGIRGGVTYGPSDEWSWKSADPDQPTYCYDVHATLLHLLGVDHTRLTVRHNSIDRRLTDVHGHVINKII